MSEATNRKLEENYRLMREEAERMKRRQLAHQIDPQIGFWLVFMPVIVAIFLAIGYGIYDQIKIQPDRAKNPEKYLTFEMKCDYLGGVYVYNYRSRELCLAKESVIEIPE